MDAADSVYTTAEAIAAAVASSCLPETITVSAVLFETLLNAGLIEFRQRSWHYKGYCTAVRIEPA
jgi:hypothetical protein